MKPRTFRRFVLLGSLGVILLLVLFGYFVFRPWQSQRQVEAMRTDGIAAYEQGDYPQATRLIGRYINNTEQPDPELYLKHARARAKVQANDGGHVVVAVNSYREYLRRVPGDLEAMRELLPLMNTRGMYVEARSLAEELINRYDVQDIEILRELRYTLMQQQSRDADLEPVMLALHEHEDSQFSDADMYYRFLAQRNRRDEADRLLAQRLGRYPDRLDERLLAFQRQSAGLSNREVLTELSAMIGLDPETAEWGPDAPEPNAGAAWAISRVYNGLQRPDLSTAVQTRSAQLNADYLNVVWTARRLYWGNEDELLQSLRIQTSDGEPDPDVLGYQFLAALRTGDEQRREEVRAQLDSIVLDRRVNAWKKFIEGEQAFRENRMIDARIALQRAIEIYPREPTFHMVMGDVQLAQGRFREAVDKWLVANEFVNGQVGSDNLFGSMGWTAPMIRIVNAHTAQDRLIEAMEYIEELERIGQTDVSAVLVALQSKSALARRNELPRDYALRFVERWGGIQDQMPPEERAQIAPMVATILSMVDERDLARTVLMQALPYAQGQESLLIDLVDVDSRYGLGVADAAGINQNTVGANTPGGALRIAYREADSQQSTDAGLRVIEAGLANAPEQDRMIWEQVRARYLDSRNDPRAVDAWDELLKAYPDDIALLYTAAESQAYAKDLEKVDEVINKIIEKTSTEGKAAPSRLRLARANAMVTGDASRTRRNRDRALEIVRSVVASEPSNVKARTMLGNLLALTPSPGLEEQDRYTPDLQAAIDQYVTLSRQLNNRGAQNFLLEASDLAFRLGDMNQTRSLLREFTTRFADDWRALMQAGERFTNLGDLGEAAGLYQRVLNITSNYDAALSLADLQLKQGQTERAKGLLRNIAEVEQLSQDRLLRLVSLFVRSGETAIAEDLAGNGERYGLSEGESLVLYARYAQLFRTPDDQVEALQAAVTVEPSLMQAWKLLIRRLIELDRLDEAQAAYGAALSAIEADDELTRLGMLARGAPESARDMLDMPGIGDSPQLSRALKMVGEYEKLDRDAGLEERLWMLEDLIQQFPGIDAVQNYAVRELSMLPINPLMIAQLAERALKNVPGAQLIMSVAGEAFLLANEPRQALRVVELWRSNSLGTALVADVITARAMIQLEQYADAQSMLSPSIHEAIQTPERALSREILDAHSFVRLKLGEDPSQIAEYLRPLIADHRDIRVRVWLGMATNAIDDHLIGAAWIREAETVSDESDRLALGSAWVNLAMSHGVWDRSYAQSAIEQIEPLIEREPADARVLMALARAHVILARSSGDSDLGSDNYTTAVSYMMRASELDPGNLVPLLDAARFAVEGGMHGQAKSVYEQLMGYGLPDSPLKAMVLNNLAMTSLRVGLSQSESQRVLDHARAATRMVADVAPYWGTRGWVELEIGDFRAAEQSFRSCVQLDRTSPEGWVGLVISISKQEAVREAELQSAVQRVRELDQQSALTEELLEMLRKHGLDSVLSTQVP